MNLEKSKSRAKGMSALLQKDDSITINPQNILDNLRNFYANLYSKDFSVKFQYQNEDNIRISNDTKQALEGKITTTELKFALKNMKRNKVPGCSGLPVEIYIVFWNKVGQCLLDAINFAYDIGHLHDSALKGIITLIPKKHKDTRIIKNLRPISLLNTDYKLIEKVLANRLKVALEEIIHYDQKGFLASRHSGCNIRRILDIMEYAHETDMPGVILSMDFEKCFDRVDIDALIQSLKYFGIGSSFVKWTKTIYRANSCSNQ